MISTSLFLVASYRNPGFVTASDVQERKRLSDEGLSEEQRSQKLESDGFAVSPAKLMETLRSPKNAKFIKEILDSTSVPPASPKKEKYHKLTEPAEQGEIEIAVTPKAALFDTQPQATGSKRVDSGMTDEEGKDDLKAPQNSVIFIPENLKHENYIVVERRQCSVCCIEQPLRTKHCRDCNKCVAVHDHHCPWIGSCVGERNRFWFYWYLVGQDLLLWLSLVLVCCTLDN